MSQSEDPDHKGPLLKEGRMFSLRLVPTGNKLEVHVVGKEVATVDLKDFKLFATARSGPDQWEVDVVAKENYFLLQNFDRSKPAPLFDLKLKVVRKKQSETFDFVSIPAPR